MRSPLYLAALLAALPTYAHDDDDKSYKHVAIFSVDGLHSSDIPKYLAARPGGSTIATLLSHAYDYTDAWTTAPSDSFPGSLAQFTGALPRTTGVWYDDIWDRSLYPVGSDCKGKPGAELPYDESDDFVPTALFSGGIDPAHLPRILKGGVCSPLYPHQRLRVNTLWELLVARGDQTAYADKHPSYDIMRGPSGTGLTQGYFPEIGTTGTVNVGAAIAYDTLHVDAWVAWAKGLTPDPTHIEGAKTLKGVPTMFGGNFQCVSVAQKTAGYLPSPGNPLSPAILQALDFVDASLARVIAALKTSGVYDDTLIVVASKHGQSPIDPKLYRKIAPAGVTNATGVDIVWQTSDDIALLFLKDQKDLQKAVDGLNKHRNELQISDIVSSIGGRMEALGFGDPTKDPAVPDIIVKPEKGVIYTKSTAKIAEHGGFNDDDRKVACFLANPKLSPKKYEHRVQTKQIAPTLAKVLGIDPEKLQGVKAEGTRVLDGFR